MPLAPHYVVSFVTSPTLGGGCRSFPRTEGTCRLTKAHGEGHGTGGGNGSAQHRKLGRAGYSWDQGRAERRELAPALKKNRPRFECRVLDEIASYNKLFLFQIFLRSFRTCVYTRAVISYTCRRWQSVFPSCYVYWVNNVLCNLCFFPSRKTYTARWLKLRRKFYV